MMTQGEAIAKIESTFSYAFHYVASHYASSYVSQNPKAFSEAIHRLSVEGPEALNALMTTKPVADEDRIEAACEAFCEAERAAEGDWLGPWCVRRKKYPEGAQRLRLSLAAALGAVEPRIAPFTPASAAEASTACQNS